MLLRQLGALIKAGVSIVLSLSILENQSTNRKIKQILADVRRKVEAGNSLSEAMQQFPRVFSPTITYIIKTGETSGLLDTAILQVTDYWEEKLALRQQIVTSMIYPVIVLLISIGVVGFIIGYVIPRMMVFLEMMGGDLPWTTQLLVDIGGNISTKLPQIGMGLGAAVLAGVLFYLWPPGKFFVDRHIFKVPIIGVIFQYSSIIFFARTLAMLIGSGISIVDGLRATRDSISNRAVKKVVHGMEEKVLAGGNLSDPLLKGVKIFPPMVGNMVKVGEETGGMDTSLALVAEIYTQLLEFRIRKMISLIEPVMLVVLGGIVGFIAVALVGAILAGYGNVTG
nr:type II secretion system F family protein [Desulforadius tongensis]